MDGIGHHELRYRDGKPVSADVYKNAMRQLVGAVSILTVEAGGERTGFTATSVTSLSIDPPTLIVSVNRGSSSWLHLSRASNFVVSVLPHNSQDVADRFSGVGGLTGAARFAGSPWLPMRAGGLGFEHALAIFDCELEEAISRHTHSILLGRVTDVHIAEAGVPLLYWRGGYRALADL